MPDEYLTMVLKVRDRGCPQPSIIEMDNLTALDVTRAPPEKMVPIPKYDPASFVPAGGRVLSWKLLYFPENDPPEEDDDGLRSRQKISRHGRNCREFKWNWQFFQFLLQNLETTQDLDTEGLHLTKGLNNFGGLPWQMFHVIPFSLRSITEFTISWKCTTWATYERVSSFICLLYMLKLSMGYLWTCRKWKSSSLKLWRFKLWYSITSLWSLLSVLENHPSDMNRLSWTRWDWLIIALYLRNGALLGEYLGIKVSSTQCQLLLRHIVARVFTTVPRI